MYDVFVSYSSKDQKIADAVVNYLESAKIKCWIAYRDADAGELYAASIIKAIKNSSIYVLVFSENSNNSKHVLKEIDAACKYEKMIIPFKIDSCQVNDAVEYYLSSTHWLDAITQPIDTHLKRLVDLVNKHLGKTANAPANSGVSEIAQPEAAPPQAKTGVCAKCGAQLKEGLKFCTKCGTPVGAATVGTAQPEGVETEFKDKEVSVFFDGKKITAKSNSVDYIGLYVDNQLIAERKGDLPIVLSSMLLIETKYKFVSGERTIQVYGKSGWFYGKCKICVK